MENNQDFSYTYSARQQQEIKAIRDKYTQKSEDKLSQLRRLDRSVTNKASVFSLSAGITGALIMGFGMSLIMTELAAALGLYQSIAMILGVSLGIVGIILICLAHPLYSLTVKKERKKIAPLVISLTDELIK